jgi:hypothetical protein
MKIRVQQTSLISLILTITLCLQQGCFSERAQLVLQSARDQPPYVYEASCAIRDSDDNGQKYKVSLSFGNRPIGDIVGLDIICSDGSVEYSSSNHDSDNSTYSNSLQLWVTPPAGLHANFNRVTSLDLSRYLAFRVFHLKQNCLLTVRIYTQEKLDPVVVVLDVRHPPKNFFDF